MATPLAWDENELKMHCPSHSSLTTFSIVLQILVSDTKMKLGHFFFMWWKTVLLFGFFPIELALKHNILNFVAEFAPPLRVSCVFTLFRRRKFLAQKYFIFKAYHECFILYFVLYFILYFLYFNWVCRCEWIKRILSELNWMA